MSVRNQLFFRNIADLLCKARGVSHLVKIAEPLYDFIASWSIYPPPIGRFAIGSNGSNAFCTGQTRNKLQIDLDQFALKLGLNLGQFLQNQPKYRSLTTPSQIGLHEQVHGNYGS